MNYKVRMRRMGIFMVWGIWDIDGEGWVDNYYLDRAEAEEAAAKLN